MEIKVDFEEENSDDQDEGEYLHEIRASVI